MAVAATAPIAPVTWDAPLEPDAPLELDPEVFFDVDFFEVDLSEVEDESDDSDESVVEVVESPAVVMPVELDEPTDVSTSVLPAAPMVAVEASAPEPAPAVVSE
ncbi:hypothetical protein PR003_g24227 [Phytophthora rubi]|uniref:Uncharacterized protein n=1 Tax=Phytophthora rubi TaxID=129364 RepID=A0A6A4CYI5_9STRA|nr:hypothetical protein PR003_g24227 [Phytophthora rubi]